MPPPQPSDDASSLYGEPVDVDRTFEFVVEENDENGITKEDTEFLKDLAEELENEEEIAIKSANLLKILQVGCGKAY